MGNEFKKFSFFLVLLVMALLLGHCAWAEVNAGSLETGESGEGNMHDPGITILEAVPAPADTEEEDTTAAFEKIDSLEGESGDPAQETTPLNGASNPADEPEGTGVGFGDGIQGKRLPTDSGDTGKKQPRMQTRTNADTKPNPNALTRRSRVANAVQEMLGVADRQGGIGEQVRAIAQNQSQNQEKIGQAMEAVKSRGRLKKFLFGPNYKKLNEAGERLSQFSQQVEKLKELGLEIGDLGDKVALAEQIAVLEQVKDEWQNEVNTERQGFSLFGWLVKLLNK